MWTKALRSGDYPQIKNWLHTSCGFCALGVLADLYQQSHNESCIWESADRRFILREITLDGMVITEDTDLLYTTLEWAGIDDSDIMLVIARMNDGGSSFNAIAKFIEDKL
jgi:hypothetical protein